jgi:hypothetical protein
MGRSCHAVRKFQAVAINTSLARSTDGSPARSVMLYMPNSVALKREFNLAAIRVSASNATTVMRDIEPGDQMDANNPSKAFGRIFAPREDWLAQAHHEEILEPELAIIDAHHHLWEEPGRYHVEDYLADARTGHNVVASVVIECGAISEPKDRPNSVPWARSNSLQGSRRNARPM